MRDDFQDRVAGITIGAFVLIIVLAAFALINEACEAADSGPAARPSEWERR